MIIPFSVTNISFEKSRLCYNTDDGICGGCCNAALHLFLQSNVFSLPCTPQAIHTGTRSAGWGWGLHPAGAFLLPLALMEASNVDMPAALHGALISMLWALTHLGINQTCFTHLVTIPRPISKGQFCHEVDMVVRTGYFCDRYNEYSQIITVHSDNKFHLMVG